MAVQLDIVENASVKTHRGQIKEVTRVGYVTGLTQGTDLLFQALSAVGMPQDGATHPHVFGLIVTDRRAHLLPGLMTGAAVELVYRLLDDNDPGPHIPAKVSGGVFLESTETNFDRDDNPITVSHHGLTVTARVPLLIPGRTLRYTRTEQTASPGLIGALYAAKVNSQVWQGSPERTWMLLRSTFESIDLEVSPPTWRVSYEFANRTPSWNVSATFIDPNTNEPPPDLTGAGRATPLQYFEEDFNQLNLV